MRAFIASTATPLALTSAPMRRITRPQGAISRRAQLALREVPLATGTGTASTGLGTGIATSTSIGPGTLTAARAALGTTTLQLLTQPLTMIFVLPPTRGLVSFDAVSRRLPAAQAPMAYATANDLAVGNAPPRPGFQIVTAASPFVVTIGATLAQPRLPPHPVEPPEPPEPPPPKPPPPHPPKPVDSADAQAFRAAAKRHLARVNPFSFILVLPAPRPALDVVAARGTLVQLLDPAPALQMRMAATITLAGGAAPPAIAPLGHAPHFEQPMSEPLATLSQDWLLPGLDRVLPDTVALLEPNPRFVEAYMAGLNVEMGRELVWRDYPLDDPCATFFRRFWRSAQPQGEGDIAALADWGANRLGTNAGAGVAHQAIGAAGAQRPVSPLPGCARLRGAGNTRCNWPQARYRSYTPATAVSRQPAAGRDFLRLRCRPGRRGRRPGLVLRHRAAAHRAALRLRCRDRLRQREPCAACRAAGRFLPARRHTMGAQRRAHGANHAPAAGARGDPRQRTAGWPHPSTDTDELKPWTCNF